MSWTARWVTCVLLAASAAPGCTSTGGGPRALAAARAPFVSPPTGAARANAPARATAPVARATAPVASEELPPELASFHVGCAPGAPCPEGIGMLVGPAGTRGFDGHPNRCTGALIGPDLILTASHCLPAAGRRAGGSCRGLWVAFPSTERQPMEWAACDRVVDARTVDETQVLRPDWAVVRLARSVSRQQLTVLANAPPPHAIVQVVAVDPHPIYRTHHALETRLCRVRTAEEARALFGPDATRVGWLSDCPTLPGNSGAPVLDREGRVRAIVHGGSHPLQGIGVTTGAPPI